MPYLYLIISEFINLLNSKKLSEVLRIVSKECPENWTLCCHIALSCHPTLFERAPPAATASQRVIKPSFRKQPPSPRCLSTLHRTRYPRPRPRLCDLHSTTACAPSGKHTQSPGWRRVRPQSRGSAPGLPSFTDTTRGTSTMMMMWSRRRRRGRSDKVKAKAEHEHEQPSTRTHRRRLPHPRRHRCPSENRTVT